MTDISTRKGLWVQTNQGHRFWPMDPSPDDVDIYDIAHALSMQCRFNGHTKRFYSVAEHSCHVSDMVVQEFGREAGLYALLHDAAEAYVGDVARPIKRDEIMRSYCLVEERVQEAILFRLGLSPLQKFRPGGLDVIRDADLAMAWHEARCLLPHEITKRHTYGWEPCLPKLRESDPGGQALWKAGFLERFKRLSRQNLSQFVCSETYVDLEDKSTAEAA